jgi:hypothetical protein
MCGEMVARYRRLGFDGAAGLSLREIEVKGIIVPLSLSSSRVRDSVFHWRGSRTRWEHISPHQSVLLRNPPVGGVCLARV